MHWVFGLFVPRSVYRRCGAIATEITHAVVVWSADTRQRQLNLISEGYSNLSANNWLKFEMTFYGLEFEIRTGETLRDDNTTARVEIAHPNLDHLTLISDLINRLYIGWKIVEVIKVLKLASNNLDVRRDYVPSFDEVTKVDTGWYAISFSYSDKNFAQAIKTAKSASVQGDY